MAEPGSSAHARVGFAPAPACYKRALRRL